jgi:flagellar biogenesis protein FliO
VTVPDPLGAFERITVTSLLFVVLYLGIVIMLFRGFAPIFQLGRLVREMAPSRKSSVQMQIVSETAVVLDTERKPELS